MKYTNPSNVVHIGDVFIVKNSPTSIGTQNVVAITSANAPDVKDTANDLYDDDIIESNFVDEYISSLK